MMVFTFSVLYISNILADNVCINETEQQMDL